jgi:hypothetical protein
LIDWLIDFTWNVNVEIHRTVLIRRECFHKHLKFRCKIACFVLNFVDVRWIVYEKKLERTKKRQSRHFSITTTGRKHLLKSSSFVCCGVCWKQSGCRVPLTNSEIQSMPHTVSFDRPVWCAGFIKQLLKKCLQFFYR